MRLLIVCLTMIFWVGPSFSDVIETSQGQMQIERMATGLKQPWAISFLPDGSVLVTERRGRLYRIGNDGSKSRVRGVPQVKAFEQGGLLDVMVPRDFASTGLIFFTYSTIGNAGFVTAVGRAKLDLATNQLSEVVQIFEMVKGNLGGRHFGSRLVEAPNGELFVTLGERGVRSFAQNPELHHGSVVRIAKNGAPAAGGGANGWLPDVWTKGHRNAQGAALDAAGQLWVVEHGAKGGDEINRVVRGKNYGWPIISYGEHYTGGKIGEGTHKAGLEQPNFYWDPSIAPSGMMIYSGKMFPAWKGDFFVGSLKFDMISRLERNGGTLREVERIQSDATGRVRDIREGPDGAIWFLSVDARALYRISK